MRDSRGAVGTRPAEVQGDDTDGLLCGLRTRESCHPPGAPSWVNKPAVGVRGDLQSETLSLETKSDLSEADLLLGKGTKVLLYLKESVRRSSASTVAQNKTVDLSLAPAEECFVGMPCGGAAVLVRDGLGGGPGAANGHRGWCCRGAPRRSGLPCHQKRSEMRISEEEPSAFPDRRDSELEPRGLRSILSAELLAHPEAFPRGEAECASLGRPQPASAEHAAECRATLPRVKSTSNDLQTTLGHLAVRACEIAKPLCHS